MCTLAALALNVFHPGYLFEETGQSELKIDRAAHELENKEGAAQVVDLNSAHETWARRQAILTGRPYPASPIFCSQCGNRCKSWV
jgi:hypothetical protein